MKFKASDHINDELKAIIIVAHVVIGVRSRISKMLKGTNISLEEIVGGNKKRSNVAPKFKHKKDNSLTWSGRGRMPKWIKKFGVKI